MVNKIAALLLFLAALSAHATTYNVNSGQSQSTIQGVIAGAASGDTVQFAAGTYSISSSITLNCGVTYTGPVISNFVLGSNTQTAILSGSSNSFSIFALAGGCTSQTTIQWFWFQTALSLYVSGGVSNLTYRYNSATNFAQGYNVNLDGDINDTSNNINILYNEFGDTPSCAAFMGFQDDDDCDAVLNHAGNVTGLNIQNNYFFHVQEPIHIIQICTGCSTGNTVSVCNGCTIKFNYINTYARIGMEIQTSNTGTTDDFSDNIIINATQGNAFGMSFACCLSGRTYGTTTSTLPADYIDDDVIIEPASATTMPFGVEWWGNGATGRGGMIEGNIYNGYAIGFFSNPSTNYGIMANNYMCAILTSGGGYFTNEEGCGGQSCVPTNLTYPGNTNAAYIISGGNNQTATTCTQQASVAATISPSSGAQAFPLTVTMSTAGRNTSIYYTTDGTTPVPGSGSTKIYTAPVMVTAASTVKAVGMWGVPPQPTSYTAPYGYMPSAVTTASYTGGTPAAVAPTFTPGSQSITGPTSVALATTTTGATINYCVTTTTCTPSTSSSTYTSPISVNSTETINAVANATGFVQSAISTASYTLTAPGAVATPTFNPGSQTYTGTLSVAATTTTSGATLYCTSNGTTPTTSSPVYSGPFSLTSTPASTTLQCIGTAPGFTQSLVGSATYAYSLYLGNNLGNFNFQTYANGYACTYAVTGTNPGGYTVNSCVINQFGGSVTSGKMTDCAVISAPTATTEATSALCHGTWTNPSSTATTAGTISMAGCGTLPAGTGYWICTNTNDTSNPAPYAGWNCGGSCSTTLVPASNNGTYAGAIQTTAVSYGTLSGFSTGMTLITNGQFSQFLLLSPSGTPTAATPTFSPSAGTYSTTQSVTISTTTPASTLYYTTNGTTPTISSSVYSGPISVSATSTVQAIAVASGFTNSPVGSAVYTITSLGPAAMPTFTPAGPQSFMGSLSVSAASTTPSATLYCTTNGTVPTTSSPVYSGAFSLTANTILQCIATAPGFTTSAVNSATYTAQSGATVTTTPWVLTVTNAPAPVSPGGGKPRPPKH